MAKASISIDDADLEWLKRRAKRLHGGNLSAAVSEGTRLLRHLDRMHSLLDHLGAPELTDAQRDAIDRELDVAAPSRRPKRSRRAA